MRPSAPLAGAIALAAAVALLYQPIRHHDFVEWDDPLYVRDNAHVREGWSAANLRWAFTNDEAFLWHPLTWASYLLDAERAGVEEAGPFLATNTALHALNAGLALWALLALTAPLARRGEDAGRRAACFVAAGIYALHPVQVESVAWVSARKELLAAGFVLLTLVAHAHYARRPGALRLAAVAACAALGAMAKSSHVALPFLLLLLDVWPLGRLRAESAGDRPRARVLLGLALEKLPLLGIALGAAAANYAMVSGAWNVWGSDPGLPTRLAAIVANLAQALGRLVWPASLAIAYPNPLQPIHPLPGVGAWLAAAGLLLGITFLALREARRRPALAVGWLGFLGMWLPMSGLVPMGLRSPHDRYFSVPLLVLAMGLAFWLRTLAAATPGRRRAAAALGALALVACAVGTHRQIPVWRDSDALFTHALAVRGDDPLVLYALGTSLARRGELDAARAALARAVALHPGHADAHHNLGWVLLHEGEVAAARAHLERAVALRPDWERALRHLGQAQLRQGDIEAAEETRERLLRVRAESGRDG